MLYTDAPPHLSAATLDIPPSNPLVADMTFLAALPLYSHHLFSAPNPRWYIAGLGARLWAVR